MGRSQPGVGLWSPDNCNNHLVTVWYVEPGLKDIGHCYCLTSIDHWPGQYSYSAFSNPA